jgi:hypothetical protein
MNIEFTAEIWLYDGPAPWHFVTVPEKESRELKEMAALVTHGWGAIPVRVGIGHSEWQTSLFPQGDRYVLPIKAGIRKAEKLKQGDEVTIRLLVG